ncbi:hypothetical protein AB7813_00795 [Tardiphaga sp. 20_F10_N6_6]|uniref:hypothetical protein n=1 Tax=unclassified Tardiphaga TaxID=2631404 RepID=UPI003F225C91
MQKDPPAQRPRGFTAAAIENVRQRYVETTESLESIAVDFEVHRETVQRLAERQGWPLRKNRPPRDLPVALQLDLAAADVLDAAVGATPAAVPSPDVAPLVLRMERAVSKELAKVERLKDETGSETGRSIAAVRIARTLSSLTQTLFKVRALREPASVNANDPDDIPADPEAFRIALAERIERFVQGSADANVSSNTNE